MKWFENYCTLSALYSFYKKYHDMHANGDITLKYETNTENLTPKEIKEYLEKKQILFFRRKSTKIYKFFYFSRWC